MTVIQIAGVVIVAVVLLQAIVALLLSARRRAIAIERERIELERFRETSQEILGRVRSERERLESSWNGPRKFVVSSVVEEAKDVRSFYLRPYDGKPIAPYQPGQHVTLRVRIPGVERPVIRCYTLSSVPGDEEYRVSIKRTVRKDGSTPGLVSGHMHQSVSTGSILDVMAPSGEFFLDESGTRPVALIAGGIGITPMISMAETICRSAPGRTVWLFYGARNREGLAMGSRLRELARDNDNLHLVVVLSSPEDGLVAPDDYDETGHISIDLIRRYLGMTNYEFYVCGPPPMMTSVVGGLRDWGVPEENVRFEAFGPASVARPSDEKPVDVEVVFDRTGRTESWKGSGSLLDLAIASGIPVEFGCGAGSCGTCLTAVKEGSVKNVIEPGFIPERGSCLTCVSVPETRVVLDA